MILKKLFPICASLCLSACSIFGINNTPQAKYTTIEKNNSFSIRDYDSLIEAQVTVDDTYYKTAVNKGFRYLFNYITGDNTSKEKIAMTAPVTTKQTSQKIQMTAPVLIKNIDKSSWTISFVLPPKYTLETAPKPTNDKVKLVQIPKRKMAAISFSGYMNKEIINEKTKDLENWLDSNNIQIEGQPIAAGYNPPWTLPFLRTNEVLIPIKNNNEK